jgi:hypothetical protein
MFSLNFTNCFVMFFEVEKNEFYLNRGRVALKLHPGQLT